MQDVRWDQDPPMWPPWMQRGTSLQGLRVSKFFDQFFKGIDADRFMVHDIRLRVACAGVRVCPRDPMFEWHLDRGRNHIEKLLRRETLGVSHLEFVFPERWMNIHERRLLVDAIVNHPEIKSADILMQDPLIAGSVPAGCMTLVDIPNATGLSTDDFEAIWAATRES